MGDAAGQLSDRLHLLGLTQLLLGERQGLFGALALGDVLVCAVGLGGASVGVLGDCVSHHDIPDVAVAADYAVLH